MVYLITGTCTIFFGPLIGKATDKFGKFRVFAFGTVMSILIVLVYTHLGPISLPALVAINALMFVGIFSRMISYQALVSSVPAQTQRGSFNAIGASIQQLSGGIASVVAGHIVTIGADGKLLHFETVGYVVVATSLVALALVWKLNRSVAAAPAPAVAAAR
jgi:predicted MFS family arabinose efflux permease